MGAFWDFFPTFAELTAQKIDHPTDGISMLPLLLGEPQRNQHDFLYWEFHEDGGRQAVRLGHWKGIKEKVKSNPDAPIELYDLDSDPKESKNLASTYPDIVDKIKVIMKTEHLENKNFPFIKN
ncbi:sulfatase/phosphatase domain-containing protein [Pedobacter aquatilis]|uniref:sulfatase/phosphatase domain-containing protein n=1 Tax=Pedobacter aquatilis TaxID=351343 RepID=UPI002930F383|nr:sulfatase/phosphatase domain-containing protein [Pedobacter aquatilis]